MKVLLQSGKTNFIRWGKFNLVGAMGMIVQLGVLALLNAALAGAFSGGHCGGDRTYADAQLHLASAHHVARSIPRPKRRIARLG